jgi:hypothetical protein
MQKWIQPPACLVHGLHRNLSSYWLAHCYLLKNPPKASSFLVWIAEWRSYSLSSRNPKDNWCLSRIYGIRFGEKDHGLSTCKPLTEQAWGLEAFLHGAAQNFELLSNIQDQKGLSNDTTLMQIQSGRTVPLNSWEFTVIKDKIIEELVQNPPIHWAQIWERIVSQKIREPQYPPLYSNKLGNFTGPIHSSLPLFGLTQSFLLQKKTSYPWII